MDKLDIDFDDIKNALFDEVLFIHGELTKFENLFKPKPYGMQDRPIYDPFAMHDVKSGQSSKTAERVFPERVYLIEYDWWQRWMDLSKFLIYRRMLKKREEPASN